MKRFRIGLDIDDCLADFWGAYCEYFDTKNNPRMLEDSIITKNVQQVLSKDRDFWLGLKVINMPDFQPALYYGKMPQTIFDQVWDVLPEEMIDIVETFDDVCE